MNGPTLHHRARGIHPGAFVQRTAPDTSDVQDGVLWVDTSTAEPYALKCWDQAGGVWRLVGSAGGSALGTDGCLLFPDGVSICSTDTRNIVITVDPDTTPQTITLWGDTLDFGGQGGVVFQNGGMQLYDSTGQWLAYFYPNEAQIRARNADMHLRITTGKIDLFDQHGSLLELPLPLLAATPPTLLGKDPATGVPAFCPAPIPTTTTVVLGGGGGSQPAPAPQCVQMRCGVSGACRDHLVSLYQDWSHWLDPIFQAAATLGVAAAIVGIPWDWTVDLELGAVIKGGIISLLHDFGSVITGNLLPVLDLDLQNDIQRALFDHLTCTNDQVQVSADNVAAWKAALDALTTWPIASLAGPFCGLLLQYTPLARWQAAASTASPSTACDAWP